MLRRRFRAVGGIPYQPTGRPIRKPYVVSGRPIHMAWDHGPSRRDDRAPDWIAEIEHMPRLTVCPKRNSGAVATLTKVAHKATLKKLQRRYSNAEALLSERGRQ